MEDGDWGEGPNRIRKRRELEFDMWVQSFDVFSRPMSPSSHLLLFLPEV
jgi:hypothetical protein